MKNMETRKQWKEIWRNTSHDFLQSFFSRDSGIEVEFVKRRRKILWNTFIIFGRIFAQKHEKTFETPKMGFREEISWGDSRAAVTRNYTQHNPLISKLPKMLVLWILNFFFIKNVSCFLSPDRQLKHTADQEEYKIPVQTVDVKNSIFTVIFGLSWTRHVSVSFPSQKMLTQKLCIQSIAIFASPDFTVILCSQ